jgi:uroporphyrinogen decarboxylase
MNHRERVLATLNHQEPDRLPVDVWGSASRLCNELYFEIVKDQGWEELGPCVKASRSGDYVDDRISDLIDCDFRHTNIGHPTYFKKYEIDGGHTINEWGYGYKTLGQDAVVTYHPFADPDVDAIKKHPWPTIEDPARIAGLEEQVKNWHENTDYFIGTTSAVSGCMIDIGPFMRGFEDFFVDMYINKEFAHKLIGKMTDVIIELYSYYLKPIGHMVDWIEFTSDHGMQDRCLLSKDMYREFLKEPYRRLFKEIKKVAPQAKIWLHSCGAVRDLIPDFIDIGVDVLNSLQPQATGMDSFELKKEFGKDIVFHGGLDIQAGGITGTVQEAIDEAKRRIDAFAPGGGYIFAPSNHFMQDVPMENFYAIYKTALEYGKN